MATTPDEDDEFALRATRDGGYWDFARDSKGDCPAKKLIWMYSTGGTVIENALRAQEFLALMEVAERGEAVRGQDVTKIHRCEGLLELRWERPAPMAEEDRPVRFRLYFAEPAEEPDLLLALHFEKKAIRGLSERQILAEQNRQIDLGCDLLTFWRNARGKK
jgi:hypothetical protein